MRERRQLERFDLNLPAEIECLAPIKQSLSLFTRNISAGGAYFDTNRPFPQKSRIEIDLLLTIKRAENLPPMRAKIAVTGSVLRSEPAGMAVRFDEQYELITLADA